MPQTKNIKVRHCSDLSIVSELDRKIFTRDDTKIKLENTEWWVAWFNEKPVGFAGLRPLPSEPHTYFTRAGVIREARGNRIHGKLIRARLAWSKRHGYEGAMTYTVPGNVASANNLIRLGFELFEPEWEWIDSKVWYFFKDLKK